MYKKKRQKQLQKIYNENHKNHLNLEHNFLILMAFLLHEVEIVLI